MGLFLYFLAGAAYSFPNYAVLYQSNHGYLPSCLACHVEDSWELNDYGKGFKGGGRSLAAFKAMEDKDSDGDGFKNSDEIANRSNPGNPWSRPSRPGDWLKDAVIRPPAKTLKRVFSQATAHEVHMVFLDKKEEGRISALLESALPDESLFAVVFSARKDKDLLGAGTYLSVDLPGHENEPTLLFLTADRQGRLKSLKFFEYHGTPGLSKEKSWNPWIGKKGEEVLGDASAIKGPIQEVKAFKKTVARGLLTVETFFNWLSVK